MCSQIYHKKKAYPNLILREESQFTDYYVEQLIRKINLVTPKKFSSKNARCTQKYKQSKIAKTPAHDFFWI